jgi:hypothetical protein
MTRLNAAARLLHTYSQWLASSSNNRDYIRVKPMLA